MPYIVTDACIQCGACISGCESNAISEGDTQSYIDPSLCIECGTCKSNCPSEAIIYVEEKEAASEAPAGPADPSPEGADGPQGKEAVGCQDSQS